MISLTNTEIAFAHLSLRNLRRAKFIFLIMSHPILIRAWHLFVRLFLRFKIPIGWLARPTIYNQFIGGKSIDECKPIIDKFSNYRIYSILNYLAENEKNERHALINFNELCQTISIAINDPRIAFINLKPSSIIDSRILLLASEKALLNSKDDALFSEFKERFNTLCQLAYKGNMPIIIEAEESWYQPAIDDLAEEMMEKYNKEKAIVYRCFQMYRIDMLEKLYTSHRRSLENNYILGAKVVRGAYAQQEQAKASKLGQKLPIFSTKEEINYSFNNAVKFCISNIDSLSLYCGTHNEDSIIYMISLMESYRIAKSDNRIFFSQLYGMSDNISLNLANEGFNVVKYIPYGSLYDALPYLMRRSRESSTTSSNRELKYIKKEIRRRKKQHEK
ncbi:MAG: proline dehydrogenase family protein [Bacteroidales bacterium]